VDVGAAGRLLRGAAAVHAAVLIDGVEPDDGTGFAAREAERGTRTGDEVLEVDALRAPRVVVRQSLLEGQEGKDGVGEVEAVVGLVVIAVRGEFGEADEASIDLDIEEGVGEEVTHEPEGLRQAERLVGVAP